MPFLEVSTSIGGGCLRCSYCAQETIGKAYTGPRLLTLETFAAALANCPTDLMVSFAGYAEPYLNNQCSAMVELAAAQGRPVQMYTTGVGMSDADADVLIRVQPRILMLHLPDGGGDMRANVTTDYVARMARLAEAVPTFQAVCYGSMHPLLTGFARFLKNYGLHSRAGNVVKLRVQLNNTGPLKCRPAPGLDENVLIPTGELALCCNDWALQHVVGDLTRDTWQQIHAGERLNAVREAMRSGDCLCRSCEFAATA